MSTPDAFDALLDPQMLREYREESAMSTPRPWTCTCAGRDKKVWHADPTCEVHGEGVAAPLEPITAEKFFAEWGNKSLDRGHRDWPIKFAEAYAAAVSKNLQEELAALRTRWNFALKGEDEALRECRRLEKEIAALRTAQSAVTGTESHWRGRDAALMEKP